MQEVSETRSGQACFDGRGFVLELFWDAEDNSELVGGRVVLSSNDGQYREERRLELMPRFPQVFHFMGMYVHVSLSASNRRRTLYVSLPTKSKTQWRGPVAMWNQPDANCNQLIPVS